MLLMLVSMPVLCSTDYLTRERWFCTSAGLVQDITVDTCLACGWLPGRMGVWYKYLSIIPMDTILYYQDGLKFKMGNQFLL